MHKTLIIAEAGVNHNGSIERAKQLIDIAVDAEADIVKFQTFKAETLVTRTAPKAEYQKRLTKYNQTQFEMIKKLELDRTAHVELINHCKEKDIRFLSTAFDHDSIELLAELKIPFYKIPSGEITNLPYLRHIGRMGKSVILSTGMATLEEVRVALDILLEAGLGKAQITIMHCNTEYPTPMEDVNLKAMITMGDEMGVAVGYSDHTMGIEVSIAAAALGATVIEKHFTLNRSMEGPDHKASLEPDELKLMVRSIRNIENALGDGVKRLKTSEARNLAVARKSIHLNQAVSAGELLSLEMLVMLRPGDGISPMQIDNLIGRRLKLDMPMHHKLVWDDLE